MQRGYSKSGGDFASEKSEQNPQSLRDSSFINESHEILVNDTIGFIRDLPPDLIAAFTSTLEDSITSDLLLHVVDASDPWCAHKIAIVDATLHQIHADQERLYVFNKCDLLSDEAYREKIQEFQ